MSTRGGGTIVVVVDDRVIFGLIGYGLKLLC